MQLSSFVYGQELKMEVAAGMHDGKTDVVTSGRYSSKSVRASLYTTVNEIVSVGLSMGADVTDSNSSAYNFSDYADAGGELTYMSFSSRDIYSEDISVELKLSLPQKLASNSMMPYCKLGRTIWSNYTYKGRVSLENLDFDYTFKGTQAGYTYSIGSAFDLADNVSFLAELQSTKKEIVAKAKLINSEFEADVKSIGLNFGLNIKV